MTQLALFFKDQQDYIFFVYGLAFLMLAAVCFGRPKAAGDALPWTYLGWFGLVHGLYEWLELAALSVGDTVLFSATRVVLMAASYGLLVEFGRVSARRLKLWAPGPWIFLPLLLLISIGGLAGGMAGLNGAARSVLALSGCGWTSFILFSRAQMFSGTSRIGLASAGVAMALYGGTAALVLPASTPLAPNFFIDETFLAGTGVPIQLVRAFCACWIAWSIGVHEQRRDEEALLIVRHRWYFRLVIGALVLIVGLGWLLTNRFGEYYREDFRNGIRTDIALLVQRLVVETTVAQGLAISMSGAPDLAGINNLNAHSLAGLDNLVDRYGAVRPGLIAYVMDRAGNVLTCSNRDTPTSCLGNNYGFRPYFQDAFAGKIGQYFAVGVTTGEAGFYASAPIRGEKQEIIGVAVIKTTLNASAEKLGLSRFPHVFLIDSMGVVLLSGVSGAPHRLWPLPGETSGAAPDGARPAGNQNSTLLDHRFKDGDRVILSGKKFLAGQQMFGQEGWSIVLLREETNSLISRFFAILLTLTACLLTLGASLLLRREFQAEIMLWRNQIRLEDVSRDLERQASTDSLTGALNRLKFNIIVLQEINRSSRYQTPLSLIMYDIDHFKEVNDTFGHQVGDNVLVQLTRTVAANLRESDFLARWGGEEFMIIAPQLTCEEAVGLAEKLRQLVEATSFDGVGKLTCSFGVSTFVPGDQAETLANRADRALYRAKSGGRNRVEWI